LKFCLTILLIPLFTNAQICRYDQRIFSAYDKTANVIYANAPALSYPYLLESSTSNQNLSLDIFQPAGDTAQKRALIIFAHSGGFLNGTKDNEDMQALCDSFSRRGYVTASLNYRLGFNPFSSSSSERAAWRGVQDASAAVRFFKHNAALYKIDTANIFIWGSSAGSFMALGLAYMDDNERPVSTYSSGIFQPNLGCKDCTGNNYTNSSLVTGIISCWGATKDSAWIQNNNNIPVQLFHGTADATVPFTEGYPFGLSTISYVRGSQQINEQLNRTSIYHEFYPVTGLSHEYWGTSNGTFIPTGPTAYWLDIITKAKNFMLGRMTNPPACGILPVKLTSFTGQVINEKIKLYWNTASEMNLKNFIIERSTNGISFNELMMVLPLNNNGGGSSYSATDDHPYSGNSFYRLKMVDLDGSFVYSPILKFNINTTGLTITQLYPNPVYNTLYLQMHSSISQVLDLTVLDITGKRLQTNTVKLNKGMNNTSINFENKTSGIYIVQFKTKQNGNTLIFRIIKR
jgi:poly(3-hydroxybutyrate) depolymerase